MTGRRIILGLLLLLLATGCPRERNRAVTPGDRVAGEKKDYAGMLDRVRDRQKSAAVVGTIQEGLKRFQIDLGRLPTNLYELVSLKYVKDIPEAPEGFAYYYDPVHGNVQLIRANTEPPPAVTTNAPPPQKAPGIEPPSTP